MSYTNTGHGVILEAVVCQDCSGPIIFGKIPRNSSKEFLKKKNEHTRKEEEEGHRTQVTCHGIWEINEKNSSGTGRQPSQMGMEEKGLKELTPRK